MAGSSGAGGERAPAVSADNPLRQALAAGRRHYVAAAVLSALGNLLYLTPTLFMLQVYDRVVPSGSLATLALIGAVALAAYGTLGTFEWLRGRLLVKAGMRLDRQLAGPVLGVVLARRGMTAMERSEAIRELDAFRQTMAGPVMTIAFDAPWAPIYVIAAFLLNPWLGLLTMAAGAILVLLAWRSERAIHGALAAANTAAAVTYARQRQMTAHAAQVRALGMRRALTARALADRAGVNELQLAATFTGGRHGSLIKTVRLVLQSSALAMGGWLAVEQQISAGAIVATSLLMSRALSPIEQLTHNWKQVVRARTAYHHLAGLLGGTGAVAPTQLPRPAGRVSIEELTVATAQGARVAIAQISAEIAAGEVVGIAGLSGAGKSTLLSALAGALPALRGTVRIDGASIESWDPDRLADHVGYLPQDYVLFAGTIKENIARFAGHVFGDPAAIDERVVAVAREVGAHEMILRLPDGYDTVVGNGAGLSAGQAQRIALARALYTDPAILLLDEPSASLDAEGQHALMALIGRLRAEGRTVIFSTHQTDLLAIADKVMLLAGGRLARFGPLATPSVTQLAEKRA